MIAKLIASAADRDEAIDELAAILDAVEVWPVRTNAGFLFNALIHPEFGSGAIDTGFIERNLDELVPAADADDTIRRSAAAVAILAAEEEAALPGLAGLRLNAPSRLAAVLQGETVELANEDEIAEVSGFADEQRVVVFAEGQAYEFALASRGTWHKPRYSRW